MGRAGRMRPRRARAPGTSRRHTVVAGPVHKLPIASGVSRIRTAGGGVYFGDAPATLRDGRRPRNPVNDVIALYPTARKVEDWLKRNSRGRSLLDYPIMTFPQLVDRLWREFGPRGAMLDELQERLAAEEAIGGARETLGSADHVLGLIRQFKSAALRPTDLRAAAHALTPGDGAAGIRARVTRLAAVFEGYERLLTERRLSDRHDRERVVLE